MRSQDQKQAEAMIDRVDFYLVKSTFSKPENQKIYDEAIETFKNTLRGIS